MIRLEQLIQSFISVIIRFHDLQNVQKPIITANDDASFQDKSREYARDLSRNPSKRANIKEILTNIIKEGTAGYPLRSPLFNYYLHEINFLFSIINRTTPLSPQELASQNDQLFRLFKDLILLLNTPKKSSVRVKFSDIAEDIETCKNPLISVNGLQYTTFLYSTARCRTGITLVEEVFTRLDIPLNVSEERLRQIVSEFSQEHENELLVKVLSAQNQSLTQQLKDQNGMIIDLNEKLKVITTKLEEFAKQPPAAAPNVNLEKDNELLKQRVSELEERLKLAESNKTPVLPANFAAKFRFPFAAIAAGNNVNPTKPTNDAKAPSP